MEVSHIEVYLCLIGIYSTYSYTLRIKLVIFEDLANAIWGLRGMGL